METGSVGSSSCDLGHVIMITLGHVIMITQSEFIVKVLLGDAGPEVGVGAAELVLLGAEAAAVAGQGEPPVLPV